MREQIIKLLLLDVPWLGRVGNLHLFTMCKFIKVTCIFYTFSKHFFSRLSYLYYRDYWKLFSYRFFFF